MPVDVFSNTGAIIFIIVVASIVQHDPPKKKKGSIPCVVHFAFFDNGCGFHFVLMNGASDTEHTFVPLALTSEDPDIMGQAAAQLDLLHVPRPHREHQVSPRRRTQHQRRFQRSPAEYVSTLESTATTTLYIKGVGAYDS